MIEESGTIVELKGKHIAVVLCEKSSFCKNCASMEACQVGNDNRSMLVDAHNHLGAQIGDKVRVVTSSKSFLQSSFVLYIVPLLSLIAGAIAGHLIGERLEGGISPDLLSALLGTAFLVGSFLVIRVGSRAISKENYMPRIVEVLNEEDVFAEELKHGH